MLLESKHGVALNNCHHTVAVPAPGWVCPPWAPGSWLPLMLVPVWQVGLGQMPLPWAWPWLHLMLQVPSRLQQQEFLEHSINPWGTH